jgi:glycosyltransferase involved in cell wall biosynthesis
MVRRLRARGTAVVWDTDDDIFHADHISHFTGWGAKRKAREYVATALEIARTVHLVTTPSRALAAQYAEAGVEHIGIAPLIDSAFNRGRSNVKLKEYAAAGAVWLASPVGPYLGMGEDQGGRLVEDDGWYEALDRLVRDHADRAALARRASAWARKQTIEHAGRAWETSFRSAIIRARRAA